MNLRAFLLGAAFLATSCSQSTHQNFRQEPRIPNYLEHRVEYSGETLGSIAKWYTGSTSNWTAIQAANPEIKPNRIRVGMFIRIPDSLVTRTERMPPPSRNEKLAEKKSSHANHEVTVTSEEDKSIDTSSPVTTSIDTESPPAEAPIVEPPSVDAQQEVVLQPSSNSDYDSSPPAELPVGSAADASSLPSESGSGVGSFLGALGKALAPSREGSGSETQGSN